MTDTKTEEKRNLVDLAKMAEQMERYDDMVLNIVKYAKLGLGLSPEERNLLSVAYKNQVGTKRSSWRIISNMEHNEELMKNISVKYMLKISNEIETICNSVVELITEHLLPFCDEDNESKIFYMKMKGDYYRYAAEVTEAEDRKQYAELANSSYSEAFEMSKIGMKSPHPIRLGLALNYSVFFYEIMDERARACKIAKEAFDEAMKDMDTVKMSSFKDSSLIMQLLRDNLTLWTTNTSDDEEVNEPTQAVCAENQEQGLNSNESKNAEVVIEKTTE